MIGIRFFLRICLGVLLSISSASAEGEGLSHPDKWVEALLSAVSDQTPIDQYPSFVADQPFMNAETLQNIHFALKRIPDDIGAFRYRKINKVKKGPFVRLSYILYGRKSVYLSDFMFHDNNGWRLSSFCYAADLPRSADYYVDDSVMPACRRG